MTRFGWLGLPKSIALRLGLIVLSATLTATGFWLNQQFASERGPLRPLDPAIVGQVSLAAVGIVLVVWLVAILARHQAPGDGRS